MTKFCLDEGKNLFETYDKDETDALLLEKAPAADVYTKTESDATFETKTDAQAVRRNLLALINEKADQDGTYNGLTAGYAKQIVSNVRETDKTPYLFRTSGGALDIGNREFPTIVGGTVAFNQLAPNNFNVSTVSEKMFDSGVVITAGHKYFISRKMNEAADVNDGIYAKVNNSNVLCFKIGGQNTATIVQSTYSGKAAAASYIDGACWIYHDTAVSVSDLQIIDLTQLFGATIADYIYSLETATAGSGVAFCRAYSAEIFARYNAYNAGELISVQAFQHQTIGFNQFNVENADLRQTSFDGGFESPYNVATFEHTPIIPKTVYCWTDSLAADGRYLRFYDIAGNVIETRSIYNAPPFTFITPAGAASVNMMWFANAGIVVDDVLYNGNVCINLSWDGERDGQYEPYVKNVYDLAENLQLRGLVKLVNGRLEYDGDVYEHTGDVTRKYGIIDLSTLQSATVDSAPVWFAELSNAKVPASNSDVFNGICARYEPISYNAIAANTNNVAINTSGYVYVNNGSATTPPTGYLLYELATPTTETVDGFEYPQIVDDFGTEYYFDYREIPLPVGHVTEYDLNLRAKLEMAPNAPDADGNYLMNHNNGVNEYVPYVSPVPVAPTTNGTFTLKCVVSGGIPSLVWVEDT